MKLNAASSTVATRILGIDPGLRNTGFGLIDTLGSQLRYVASGCIKTGEGSLPQRLKIILDGVREVIATYKPDQVAVEIVFVNVNPQSTLLRGQARGAAICGPVAHDLPVERIQAVLDEYHMELTEDLLEEIGLGNRMAFVVARRLLTDTGEQLLSHEGPLAIRGTEGLVLSYAKCCTPIPGDPIVGHLSAGKGMVVHLDTCKNISDIRHNPEKCIQLSWAKDVSGEFNVELRVELEHQRGLIALLAGSVNAADGNIEKISLDERDGRVSVVQLVVSVHDRVHLARVIRKLRALKGVMRITRLRA